MKSLYTTLALLSLLVLSSSCKQKEENAADTAETAQEGQILVSNSQFEANDMALGNPKMMDFPEVIRVSGAIDVPPENRVIISAVYGGFVKKISLLEGDQVRKGQVVVTLENPEFIRLQQQYLEVREQLPYLKSEYERQEVLFQEEISSEKAYLRAKSDYLASLAREKSLAAQLRLLGIRPDAIMDGDLRSAISITTPIAGKVTRVGVRTGAYVSPATEIMEVINNDHIHLELQVFEQDINQIRIGQPIRYRIPEVSNLVREGSVHLIGSNVDEKRTVKVHGHVRDEDLEELMVGMFVQADILADPGEAGGQSASHWAVPEEAVVSEEDSAFVLVLEGTSEQGYTFRKEPVETGSTSEGYTALIDPGSLKASDQVLTRGAFMASGL